MDKEEEFNAVQEILKERINGLLWQMLPPDTTLRDAEDMAVDFHTLIINKWLKYAGERRHD